MKVKIGDTIYDSNEAPIMIIFDNDAQRKEMITHLGMMPDREGVRKYGQFPSNMPQAQMQAFAAIQIHKLNVNGKEHDFVGDTISVDDLIRLAYDSYDKTTVFSTTYSRGVNNQEGIMNREDKIPVQTGMIFNIAVTGNAS